MSSDSGGELSALAFPCFGRPCHRMTVVIGGIPQPARNSVGWLADFCCASQLPCKLVRLARPLLHPPFHDCILRYLNSGCVAAPFGNGQVVVVHPLFPSTPVSWRVNISHSLQTTLQKWIYLSSNLAQRCGHLHECVAERQLLYLGGMGSRPFSRARVLSIQCHFTCPGRPGRTQAVVPSQHNKCNLCGRGRERFFTLMNPLEVSRRLYESPSRPATLTP